MGGLLLHLASPIQSWGAPSQFSTRLTHPHPTRSALTGLLACALGRDRDQPVDDLAELAYTVRVDRPGRQLRDYHTVGGGYPRERTVITAEGKRRKEATATLVSHRWYLSDAAFTVAVTGPDTTIALAAQALRSPVWHPYLGRRSCPPSAPLLITTHPDPVAALDLVPLHRTPDQQAEVVQVGFIHEAEPGSGMPPSRVVEDVPAPDRSRNFGSRALWEEQRALPAELCAGYGTHYLTEITAYRDRLRVTA
ncbi:type I-E CRISPR-associated protein Cas5/CasD [Streptacidiphilus sp. MAP5-3]|uniref:type I-E CRISPR-associated protein Cas5/CasD n=1 Tax=unclassified Streptacidiphilus TaxID=2643834 RepID=UPI00351215FE